MTKEEAQILLERKGFTVVDFEFEGRDGYYFNYKKGDMTNTIFVDKEGRVLPAPT